MLESGHLWSGHNIMRPLGFDVLLRGHWEFCGLNEGVRVNSYSSETGEHFALIDFFIDIESK